MPKLQQPQQLMSIQVDPLPGAAQPPQVPSAMSSSRRANLLPCMMTLFRQGRGRIQ